jgi:hypothetical protein
MNEWINFDIDYCSLKINFIVLEFEINFVSISIWRLCGK